MALVLKELRAIHEKAHGTAATDAEMPALDSVGMHNLAKSTGTADNAANAQKCVRVECQALVTTAVKEHMGEEKFDALSEAERTLATKLYGGNCHRHLANTWIDGGAKSEMTMLDELIPAEHVALARFLRCTTDVNKLIHAYSKGLGEGQNRYGKGFGEAKRAMLKEHCGKELYLTVQRTDKGTRMDAATEAAFEMYHNRQFDVRALRIAVYTTSNVLRDNLLVMLTSQPVVGCLRARALVHDKFTERYRFFAASETLDHWGLLEMAPVADCARAMFVLMAQDPAAVATLEYDAFESLRATTPEYDAFLSRLDGYVKMSVDQKTEIAVYSEVRREIYTPTDADNIACSDVFLKAVRAWGTGMLERLDNGWGKEYCTGGEYGVDRQTPEMRVAVQDSYRHTNIVEGKYGQLKYYTSIFDNVHPSNASGVVCNARDHVFPRLAPKHQHTGKQRKSDEHATSRTVKRRRRAQTETDGRLSEFSSAVVSSLVKGGRMGRKGYQQRARDDHNAALAAHDARDKEIVKQGLHKLVKAYRKAKNAFAGTPIVSDSDVMGRTQLNTLEARLEANLKQQRSGGVRSRVLKENIERFVNGMALARFAPKSYTSSDSSSEIGEGGSEKNVAFLTSTLVGIYRTVKSEKLKLPTAVVVPEMHTRKLATFGEPTLQRVELEKGETVDEAELERLSQEQMVAPRPGAPSKRRRATKMPDIDDKLVGKKVDVAFHMTYNLRGGGTASGVFWCPGVIEKCSDAETTLDGTLIGTGWLFVAYKDGDSGWILAAERWRWGTFKAGSLRFIREDADAADDSDEDDSENEFENAVDAGESDNDEDESE